MEFCHRGKMGTLLVLDSLEILVRRTTSGTWLAGTTWPTTVFVGISVEWVHTLCREMSTLKDPGCHSTKVAIGSITAVGNWGPGIGSMSMWACIQCPLTLELVSTLILLNVGMVTFYLVWIGPLTSSR